MHECELLHVSHSLDAERETAFGRRSLCLLVYPRRTCCSATVVCDPHPRHSPLRPQLTLALHKGSPALWVQDTLIDENEREHTKTGKRYRDEETTGNEFMKCPHD